MWVRVCMCVCVCAVIYRDKTMADKLMYIPNYDKLNCMCLFVCVFVFMCVLVFVVRWRGDNGLCITLVPKVLQ